MIKSRIFAVALAAGAALGTGGWLARAQVEQGAPIRVKAKTAKAPKPKQGVFKGEVLHADIASITVRDPKNSFIVRTFTLSPKAKEQMQKALARGGYQYGDKVEIKYEAGSDVALSIKGKPSKPF